jgi:hypothetical protein
MKAGIKVFFYIRKIVASVLNCAQSKRSNIISVLSGNGIKKKKRYI